MKKIMFLIPCFLLLTCGANKPEMTVKLKSECPKNGTCSIELLKGKSMALKKDEFGRNIYTLEENANKSVIKYSYSKTVKDNLQDAGYREEIIFEWSPKIKTILNEELQNTKMLFGRFCYCKGQTGYYKISKGSLKVTPKRKEKSVTLHFETDEVPQIIKDITFSIK